MSPALALASLLFVQQAPAHPRAAVAEATLAVEGGSADELHGRLSARIAAHPGDRVARLGRATLAWLTYNYAAADAEFAGLLADDSTDAVALEARLGAAQAALATTRLARAESLFAAALPPARARGDSAGMIVALSGLAAIRLRTRGAAAALQVANEAVALASRAHPGPSADALCRRADVRASASMGEAGPDALRGIELARGARAPRAEADCLRALARDLARVGGLDSAVALLASADRLLRGVHDRGRRAATLQWRGYLLTTIGEYGTARADLEAAVVEGTAAGNASAVAWALMSLGALAFTTGDLPSAARAAERAESLFVMQMDGWGVSSARGLRGGLLREAGDLEGARTAIRSSLGDLARFNAPMVPEMHRYLAHVAIESGDKATAERELEAAAAGMRGLDMAGGLDILQYDYGLLALARSELPAARKHLERFLRALDADQATFRYVGGVRLAQVLALAGDVAGAETSLTAAMAQIEAWRARLDDRALKVASFGLRPLDPNPDAGFARAIATIAASGRTAAGFALAERRRARTLADRMIRLDALRVPRPGSRGAAAPLIRATGVIESGAVARELPPGAALIEYVTGPAAPTTVFVVSREGVTSRQLPAADALAPAIERFVAMLAAGDDPRALARELGAALLDSVAAIVPASTEQLIIVPDAGFHELPFDALVLAGGQRVVERFSVAIAPSAEVAVRLWRRPRTARATTLLALGDPAAAADPAAGEATQALARAFAGAGGLGRLAGSAAEARAVGRFAPGAEVWLGTAASEARLKRTPLRGYRIIHLAAHALVDDAELTGSAIALAPGEGDDGFITAAELSGLELDADLVVLSGCRTAGGVVVRGEGVQGLTAPLLHAGARAVVATMWPVRDRGAAAFVERFYQSLAGGKAAGAALRAAKLAARADGVPAADWAAFSLVGDPTVTVPLSRRRGPAWGWMAAGAMLGAVAAAGLVALYRRRKGRSAERA